MLSITTTYYRLADSTEADAPSVREMFEAASRLADEERI
jgi:hypothetical protein